MGCVDSSELLCGHKVLFRGVSCLYARNVPLPKHQQRLDFCKCKDDRIDRITNRAAGSISSHELLHLTEIALFVQLQPHNSLPCLADFCRVMCSSRLPNSAVPCGGLRRTHAMAFAARTEQGVSHRCFILPQTAFDDHRGLYP